MASIRRTCFIVEIRAELQKKEVSLELEVVGVLAHAPISVPIIAGISHCSNSTVETLYYKHPLLGTIHYSVLLYIKCSMRTRKKT
jgi:hypothetical protein